MRAVAGLLPLAILAGCGGDGASTTGASSPARHPAIRAAPRAVGDAASPTPKEADLVAVADLGVLRGRCPYDGPARLVYVDRSGTGVDLRVRVGGRTAVHKPSPGPDIAGIVAPRAGAGFAPLHLVIFTTREPEEIRATVDLRLTPAPTGTHPSGCALGHVGIGVTTRSHLG